MTGYQYDSRQINYIHTARTTLGHSDTRTTKPSSPLFAKKKKFTFHEQLRFVGKKNVTSLSTHNTLTRASTSVWNKSRDHLVDFDWQHMFKRVKKRLNTFDSPIKKVNRSNCFCYCVKVRTISSRHPEKLKKFFSVSLDFGASAATTGKSKKRKSEGSSDLNSHSIPSILQ